MEPAKPVRIAQVAITIRDLDRAKAFYRDVLGLDWLFDAPPGLSFFQCGEVRLMLSQPKGPETVGNSILYYAVEDLDAAHAALSSRGVAFDQDPHLIATVAGKDIHLAICRDNEGNLLGLMSESPSSTSS